MLRKRYITIAALLVLVLAVTGRPGTKLVRADISENGASAEAISINEAELEESGPDAVGDEAFIQDAVSRDEAETSEEPKENAISENGNALEKNESTPKEDESTPEENEVSGNEAIRTLTERYDGRNFTVKGVLPEDAVLTVSRADITEHEAEEDIREKLDLDSGVKVHAVYELRIEAGERSYLPEELDPEIKVTITTPEAAEEDSQSFAQEALDPSEARLPEAITGEKTAYTEVFKL